MLWIIKVGIVGSFSTGKTTLCHELIAKLRKISLDFGFVKEISRYCPYSIKFDESPDDIYITQIWLMNAQINQELVTTLNFQWID